MIAVAYVYQADQVPTGSTGGDYWEIPATATSGAYLSDETVAHEDQKPRTLPLSHCATHHRPAAVARRGLNSSLSPEHVAALAERALARGRTAPGGARRPRTAQRLSTPYEGATGQELIEAGPSPPCIPPERGGPFFAGHEPRILIYGVQENANAVATNTEQWPGCISWHIHRTLLGRTDDRAPCLASLPSARRVLADL